MSELYRRLAVFVDHPSENSFLWILLESTEDPAVWLDLETSEDTFETWIDAFDAGNAALLAYVDDELIGPVESSPGDDDAELPED